jgi:hypothetical protein
MKVINTHRWGSVCIAEESDSGAVAIDRKYNFEDPGSNIHNFIAMLEGMYEHADKIHAKGFSKEDIQYFETGLRHLKEKLEIIKSEQKS